MRISTAIAAVLLSVLPVTASANVNKVTPFDLRDDGSIVVPVTIGGTGPYLFVIDTGSSRTVISTQLWHTLRLPVLAQTIMVTPAGRDLAYVVRLDAVGVGNGSAVNVRAAVLPTLGDAAGQPVDGLIGQDVLAALVYTIDYRARAVIWHGPDELLPGVRLPLLIRDNRVVVSLAQRDGDPSPLQLIPDTGSDGLVLFAHARDKLRVTPLDVGLLSSLAGVSRIVHRVEVEGLVIGSAQLRRPLAVILDSGESPQMMGDGLLPLHVFARVTFNAGEGYLIVQPR